jgi:hypothetical protein
VITAAAQYQIPPQLTVQTVPNTLRSSLFNSRKREQGPLMSAPLASQLPRARKYARAQCFDINTFVLAFFVSNAATNDSQWRAVCESRRLKKKLPHVPMFYQDW